MPFFSPKESGIAEIRIGDVVRRAASHRRRGRSNNVAGAPVGVGYSMLCLILSVTGLW